MLKIVFDEYTQTYDARGSQYLDLAISERLRLIPLSLCDCFPVVEMSHVPLFELLYSIFLKFF